MKIYLNLIYRYTKCVRGKICAYILIRLIKTAITLVIPLSYSNIITSLLSLQSEAIAKHIIFLAVANFVLILADNSIKRIENSISVAINYNAKKNILQKLYAIPPYEIDHSHGKIFSILTSDVIKITTVMFTIISIIFTVVSIIGTGIIVLSISWKLSLLILCTFPFTFALNFFFRKKIKIKTQAHIQKNDDFIDSLKDAITNMNETKMLNSCDLLQDKIDSDSLGVSQTALSQLNTQSNYYISIKIVDFISYITMTVLGVLFVANGQIIFGDFIAFNTYARNLSNSITSIVNINATLQQSYVSLDRIEMIDSTYIESIQRQSKKSTLSTAITSVTFDNVNFSYGKRKILSNLCINLQKGEIIGFKGQNATGKTTIANLFVCNILPTSGTIYFNNTPINKLSYTSIIEHISYVGANKILFPLSIRDNLFMQSKCYHDDYELVMTCSKLNLLNDINNFPDRFETLCSGSFNLSSGQIQKIQIIRALFKNSDILIFDEAFTNLDTETREQIKQILLNLKLQGKIIIIISHFADDYSICDRSYLIEKGGIVKEAK